MKGFKILFPVFLIIGITTGYLYAQDQEVSLLFRSDTPVEMKLSFSIRDVKKIHDDTVYTASVLHFKNESGAWESIKVDLRARGNFRRKACFFPPIRIKIKKKHAEGTLFEGNKNLKLVLPCQNNRTGNDLVIKEYICYQLFEPMSPYYFNTRLVNLTLEDLRGKQSKTYTVNAFLIEDDDVVARRSDGKILDDVSLHPLRLHDTLSTMHDFFEYMIANTDWSSVAQHNIKILQLSSGAIVPLAYDFDMAGLVNAPYATVSEQLPISSVRERVYRGFCRDEALMQHVRNEYLKLEAQVWKAFYAVEKEINPKDLPGMQKYINEFFDILKNDRSFKENILLRCRTN